jgi:integrase
VAALAEHLEEFAAPEPDGLVFPSGRGAHLQRNNLSRLVWRPAVKQLGMEGLRFHDLRHTAATLAAAAGAATRELIERIGHTSPSGGPALPARHRRPAGCHRRWTRWSARPRTAAGVGRGHVEGTTGHGGRAADAAG